MSSINSEWITKEIGDAFFQAVDEYTIQYDGFLPLQSVAVVRNHALDQIYRTTRSNPELRELVLEIGSRGNVMTSKTYMQESLIKAIHDARRLAELAIQRASTEPSLANEPIVPLLSRSKASLLRLANLDEFEKNTVLNAALNPNAASLRPFFEDIAEPNPAVLVVASRVNRPPMIGWHGNVEKWIAIHEIESRGCPAATMIAGREGRGGFLTHVFFDELVSLAYGDRRVLPSA